MSCTDSVWVGRCDRNAVPNWSWDWCSDSLGPARKEAAWNNAVVA